MKKIMIIMACAVCFIFGVCTAGTVSAEQTRPLKIWYENTNGSYHTFKVVDDNTGVNYIVVSTERGGGDHSIAITPRLNADGSLYTGR